MDLIVDLTVLKAQTSQLKNGSKLVKVRFGVLVVLTVFVLICLYLTNQKNERLIDGSENDKKMRNKKIGEFVL